MLMLNTPAGLLGFNPVFRSCLISTMPTVSAKVNYGIANEFKVEQKDLKIFKAHRQRKIDNQE